MDLGVKIALSLKHAMTLVGFITIAIAIYAGFQKWGWFITIPLWAATWLIIRILKRYFSNLAEPLNQGIEYDLSPNNGQNFN